MAESLVYKPRKDLSDNLLFRLSLYYIYVSPETWQVASLLNQLHKLKPKIATQEVKSTYLHLHDTEHPMWVRAKDMARTEPDELKRIMRDEIGLGRDMWDVGVALDTSNIVTLLGSVPLDAYETENTSDKNAWVDAMGCVRNIEYL